MGLFDKKYCDICGEKIGLLGNRKLEDGNLCKDCAKKLSPFFSERRNSTVDEIKQQLTYREENERKLADFRPDMTFGDGKKVYVDRAGARFIVTSASNWRSVNPDLISFSQVTGVNTDIQENKTEIYYRDEEGNRKSYVPRRYECNYEFNVTIMVNSPWFDKIELELSDGNRPDSPYTDLYRRYEEQMHTLSDILNGRQGNPYGQNNAYSQGGVYGQSGVFGQNNYSAPSASKTREQELMEETLRDLSWTCKKCGLANSGTVTCRQCGGPVSDENVLNIARNIAQAKLMAEGSAAQGGYAPQSNPAPAAQGVSQSWVCPSCGSQNSGKFCENCGTPRS